MIQWRKRISETFEISKYTDCEISKYVIYNRHNDGEIDKIIDKHLDQMYDEVKKKIASIKDEIKELCKNNDGLIYYDEKRKIINGKIYYSANNKYRENKFECGEFEYELEILKRDIAINA